MAEIRINATGGVKLYDVDDSHYAQIIAGTITSNTDVMTLGHAAVVMGTKLDMNGSNLILDADADTYLDTGTDDTIKVYVSGAHDLTIGANAINVLSGTTLTIDSGATITNSGTANGFSSADPASADGDTLGTASLEWSDLYLADSSVIYFGNDQDTTLTHTDGTGLTLNSTNKLCFNDASQYIQGASNAILDIAATDEIELTATLLDVNANLDVSGTSLLPTLGVITAKDLGAGIHIRTADSGASVLAGADELVIENNGVAGLSILTSTSTAGTIAFGDSGDNDIGMIQYDHNTNILAFTTSAVSAWQIGGTNDFRSNTSAAHSQDSFGATYIYGTDHKGLLVTARADGTPCILNRTGDDGNILEFQNQGSLEGAVSISGTTTAYGTFCGIHWSRLADNSKPTILRGTVMESIATMMDWYQLNFDENGTDRKANHALGIGESVGDVITYNYEGAYYQATIVQEDNEQLPMCKISDTSESKAVYGVFMNWDDDDDGTVGVNDMNIASLGAFVVRVHSGETVAIGDYLQSKGDGTAKVQADDILRASTIGKVTSTEKTITHADGSYCVPCTLHCG